MRTTAGLSITILVLASFLGAGCGSGAKEETAGGGSPAVGSEVGDLAPDFRLERVEGGTLTLSSLRGKTVILDFWDTWCPPCRRSLPDLQAISEEYSDDLVVVGFAMAQEGPEKVRQFTRKLGLTFEVVLFNQDRALLSAFGDVPSIPTTYLIDPEGVIRYKWVGAAPRAAYEAQVVKVLGSGA